MTARIRDWVARHDPTLIAWHRAIKMAVVLTVALAIATLVSDNVQLAVFASFGTVAILLFADFPGTPSARTSAFLMLFAVGAVLIVLGTLCSELGWLAVVSMAVVGFVVSFAGVLSAAAAGATRAALLTFILPVTIPATAAEIPARLGGWTLATVLTVPIAVLVWPPRDHDALRAKAADACRALAEQLTTAITAGSAAEPEVAERASGAAHAVAALGEEFRNVAFRPVGLTTGSRLLTQLIDQLDWLRSVAAEVPVAPPNGRPESAQRLLVACVSVLEACATTVAPSGARPTAVDQERLAAALTGLQSTRREVVHSMELIASGVAYRDQPVPTTGALTPAVVHEIVYTTELVGNTVAASAVADARSLPDRLLGRHGPHVGHGVLGAAREIASRRLSRNSVWLQNSVRAALGLSAAVLLVQVTHVGHSFWVVLGTLSVLRTTALATGSTAARALLGTVIGFAVGAALVLVLGTSPVSLWTLLPLTVFVAGYAPTAISFAAGQAAFTVLVVILFNIIDPIGWRVGLVRIEDVALGCTAGLVCGVMLWPSGAAAQIRAFLAETYRAAADALSIETRSAVVTSADDAAAGEALRSAQANTALLDDAFRSYLCERGAKPYPVHELTVAANGARRVSVAAEAIALAPPAGQPEAVLAGASAEVTRAAEATGTWYREAAAALAGSAPPPPVSAPPIAERAVLAAVTASPPEPPGRRLRRPRPDAVGDRAARRRHHPAAGEVGTAPHRPRGRAPHHRSRGVRLSAGRRPGCRRGYLVRSGTRGVSTAVMRSRRPSTRPCTRCRRWRR